MRQIINAKIHAIDEQDGGLANRIAQLVVRMLQPVFDAMVERMTQSVLAALVPKIESTQQIQPRWLSVESAGAYIDKTYQGMRYTLREFPQEIPVTMVGDKPRIDIKDIDRFMMNRKGK